MNLHAANLPLIQIRLSYKSFWGRRQHWSYLTLKAWSWMLQRRKSVVGCGSVDRAVAHKTTNPQFEFSHRQNLFTVKLFLKKSNIKKKSPVIAHLLRKNQKHVILALICVKHIWLEMPTSVKDRWSYKGLLQSIKIRPNLCRLLVWHLRHVRLLSITRDQH